MPFSPECARKTIAIETARRPSSEAIVATGLVECGGLAMRLPILGETAPAAATVDGGFPPLHSREFAEPGSRKLATVGQRRQRAGEHLTESERAAAQRPASLWRRGRP